MNIVKKSGLILLLQKDDLRIQDRLNQSSLNIFTKIKIAINLIPSLIIYKIYQDPIELIAKENDDHVFSPRTTSKFQ